MYNILKERFKELSKPLDCVPTGEKPKLKTLSGIKAILFDFYGTLFISGVGDIGIDDGTSNPDLLLESLDAADINVKNPEAGTRGFYIYNKVVTEQIQSIKATGILYPEPDIRKVWRNVLDQMLAEDLISTDTQTEHHERMAVEFEARMNPVWPMPDLHKTLSAIKEKDYAIGIISNSQFYTPIAFEALAGKSLKELNFDPDLLHWSFEESMKKPGFVFYDRFLKKARKRYPDHQPEHYLYVGNDMLKDVYPAQKAGMKTALFAGDKRSLKWRKDDNRTKNIKPDLVITELKQILECV